MILPSGIERYVQNLANKYGAIAFNWTTDKNLEGEYLFFEEDVKPVETGYIVTVLPLKIIFFPPNPWDLIFRGGRLIRDLKKEYTIQTLVPIREEFSTGTVDKHFKIVQYLPGSVNKLANADLALPFIQALRDRLEDSLTGKLATRAKVDAQNALIDIEAKRNQSMVKIIRTGREITRAANPDIPEPSSGEEGDFPNAPNTVSLTGRSRRSQ